MDLDESWCAITLRYVTSWRTDVYDEAGLLRSLATQAHNDDSSNDTIRHRYAEEATRAENLAGKLGQICEWLERDLVDRRKRRQPLEHFRFADAVWVPGDDG